MTQRVEKLNIFGREVECIIDENLPAGFCAGVTDGAVQAYMSLLTGDVTKVIDDDGTFLQAVKAGGVR